MIDEAIRSQGGDDGILSQKLLNGMVEYGITKEDLDSGVWKYAGGNDGRHLTNFYKYYGDFEPLPKSKEYCICGQKIKINCYITDDKRRIILGSCCIKKFEIPLRLKCERCGALHKNRTVNLCSICKKDPVIKAKDNICEICKKPHRNRKNNFCNDCRDEIGTKNPKKCKNCEKYHDGAYNDLCHTCFYKCTNCGKECDGRYGKLCLSCFSLCTACMNSPHYYGRLCAKCAPKCKDCHDPHDGGLGDLCIVCKDKCKKCKKFNKTTGKDFCEYCRRNYIDIPFSMKDEVKKFGAWFDWNNKKWFFNDKLPKEYAKYSINPPNNPSKPLNWR